jgi:hypothetical protein
MPFLLEGPNQVLERAPLNELDKCTIISIFPRAIISVKETTQPNTYHIPAGEPDKPASIVVGSSSWWMFIGPERPKQEITHGSIQVAHAIVNDYCSGLLGHVAGQADPGIFFIKGEYANEVIKTKFATELAAAVARQRQWFFNLIEKADVDWSRTNGNPKSVSDLSRLAAERLGLKDKPWMQDFQSLKKVACVACGNLRDPNFPICPACNTIVDRAKYDALKLAPKV